MADVQAESIPKDDAKGLSKPTYDPSLSQQKRRELLLEWQKSRRDEILDKLRNLDESGASESEGEEVDFLEEIKRSGARREGGPRKPFAPKSEDQVDWSTMRDRKDSEKFTKTNEANQLHVDKKMDESYSSGAGRGRGRGRGAREESQNANTDNNWRSNVTGSGTRDQITTADPGFKRRQRRPLPYRLMLSEWLREIPHNLLDDWMGVLCPVGKRCIVFANRGKTKVFTRRNEYWGQFSSALPGGSNAAGNRRRGLTILDCLWSEKAQMFYILDLICWNSQSVNNCPTDLRHFLLLSKFQETPELSEKGDGNAIPFLPLPFFAAENLAVTMANAYPAFPDDIDGLLLYHKNVFYIPEVTPLVLWMHLSDLPNLLAIDVNPDLLARERTRNPNARYYLEKPVYKEKVNHSHPPQYVKKATCQVEKPKPIYEKEKYPLYYGEEYLHSESEDEDEDEVPLG